MLSWTKSHNKVCPGLQTSSKQKSDAGLLGFCFGLRMPWPETVEFSITNNRICNLTTKKLNNSRIQNSLLWIQFLFYSLFPFTKSHVVISATVFSFTALFYIMWHICVGHSEPTNVCQDKPVNVLSLLCYPSGHSWWEAALIWSKAWKADLKGLQFCGCTMMWHMRRK